MWQWKHIGLTNLILYVLGNWTKRVKILFFYFPGLYYIFSYYKYGLKKLSRHIWTRVLKIFTTLNLYTCISRNRWSLFYCVHTRWQNFKSLNLNVNGEMQNEPWWSFLVSRFGSYLCYWREGVCDLKLSWQSSYSRVKAHAIFVYTTTFHCSRI